LNKFVSPEIIISLKVPFQYQTHDQKFNTNLFLKIIAFNPKFTILNIFTLERKRYESDTKYTKSDQ
jgi:hypothetical protein